MKSNPSCVFCKIVKEELPSYKIYEDSTFLAFLDIYPLVLGQIVLIPKSHVDSVFDLKKEYSDFFMNAQKLVSSLQRATQCVRVCLVIEGYDVPHAHIKLIPTHAGKDLHVRSTAASPEQLAPMAEKIRQNL